MSQSSASPGPQLLLQLASDKLKAEEAHARQTGERFNLFNVLGIGHREVTTHTPLLVELLNPSGSHGQGSTFLKVFLEQLGVSDFRFDSRGIRVKPEVYLGPVTDHSGGKLDIEISDGQNCTLFIENKIYAGEQRKQLARYHARNPKARLIFLTLQGDVPKTAPAGVTVTRLSYKEHIMSWLERCEALAEHLSPVREVLRQYRRLIQQLTHSTSHTVSESLAHHILSNDENLAAFCALLDTKQAVRKATFQRWNERMESVATELGLTLAVRMKGNGDRDDGWSFGNEDLAKANLRIGFQAETSWGRDFGFGFQAVAHQRPCPIQDSLTAAFSAVHRMEPSTSYWPVWGCWAGHYQMDEAQFSEMLFGSLAQEVSTTTRQLLEMFQRLG